MKSCVERGVVLFNVLAKITELRESRGWSTYRLAKLSNIPQSTIATWYSKNLYPPLDKLEIICNTFNITLSDFFKSSDYPLTDDQDMLIQKWNLLTDSEKRAIITVMDEFNKKKS